jgi:hypothetical protein
MKMPLTSFLLLIPIYFQSCSPKPCPKPLIAKESIDVTKYYKNLFSFVGEKIEVIEIPSEHDGWTRSYKAKYKVLQTVYGCYAGDIIEFKLRDHEGFLAFSFFKNSLFFLEEANGEFIFTNDFFDVYRTKNDRWAGIAANISDTGKMKPQLIDYADPVDYNVVVLYNNRYTVHRNLPDHLFATDGDKKYAIYGNYVEDLFRLKTDTHFVRMSFAPPGVDASEALPAEPN